MAEPGPVDLDICAEEPIRIPGGIQPHGALIVIDPQTLNVVQASANAADYLGGAVSGRAAVEALGADVRAFVEGEDSHLLRGVTLPTGRYLAIGHKTAQGTVIELEHAPATDADSLDSLHPRLQRFADEIGDISELDALCQAAADEIRAITGFNRVLVYRFNADWHGTVLAESSDGVLPGYLGLRFPASDIPAQARDLYRLNPIRMIPTADYTPIPIVPTLSPLDGQPLDLSFAALRSVSPVHLEYMRNMGTLASMSISIVADGKLWGLISCHNQRPRRVSAHGRTACNFLGKMVSLQVAAVERGAHAAQRISLKASETELVARLSRASSIASGLADNGTTWMALTGAAGAAVVTGETVRLVGLTPSEDDVRALARHLGQDEMRDVFFTSALGEIYEPGRAFADVASGVVAVSISQIHTSYVMWFRPEVIETVTWAGDPKKPTGDAGPSGRLHPRASFAHWQELVRGRAEPWRRAELESAEDFRNALVNFVLRRAEEQAQLTEELERSNKELEAFSYSVSHDLRAPFRHIVGYAELLSDREDALDNTSRHYLDSIIGAALSAGQLVDDLLSFAQLGRTNVLKTRVDMNKLVDEVRRGAEPDTRDRQIVWQVDPLPPAWGDAALLRQALANLIGNAIKYSRDREPARITVSGETRGAETVYRVIDNGVGFDMTYVDKLFGVFQRLHRVEDFEGTGIGLALTKRVIDRHNGWIEADGTLHEGATFTFGLPVRNKETNT